MKTKKQINATQASGLMELYPSMASCAANLGIPLATIKTAKRAGAKDAFDSSGRVRTLPLIRWLFAQDLGEDGIEWGNELKKEQAKREKIKRLKEEGETLERGEVSQCINRGMSMIFGQLEKAIAVDLPPELKGLTAPEIHARLVPFVESLKANLSGELMKLVEEKE